MTPTCRICYKSLPEHWQGFDLCPMCDYLIQVRMASKPHAARPSYESPLRRLEKEFHGHN